MDSNEIDILIISDNGLNTVGGEQESTKIIINGLKDRYILGVIQPGEIKKAVSSVQYFELTKKTRIKHLIKNPFSFIKYIGDIRRVINTKRPKIIHTQSQVSFFIVALLKKFRLISNNHYLVHTERGLYTKYSLFFKYIFFFFMKELNTLVTTTEFNMKYWKETLERKQYSLNYKIIENTAGEIFEDYDESFNINEDNIVIGFAGRYANWKNWPLAIEISEKLNNVIGDKLSVKMAVGCLNQKALNETISMFEYLEGIFGDRFVGNININLKEMDKFYYDIDIFILTSDYNTESFGRTLVEAMSRKTVVLTTDSGGSVEVVSNPNNVHNTANDFVNRIIELYNDTDKITEEKEKNLIRVREIYSLKNNIDKHISLYSDILGY